MRETPIKIVHYGVNTLQSGDRIKLPEPLLKTLDIKKGQDVEILLDTEEGYIILKKTGKTNGEKRG